MNKTIFKIGVLCFLTSAAIQLHAQDYILKKVQNEKGNTTLVTFSESKNLKADVAAQVFENLLQINPSTDLKLINTKSTKNLEDQKFQQYYQNIPVEFGNYSLHFKNGNLTSMNGELFSTKTIIGNNPSLSAQQALNKAIQYVGAEKYMWEDQEYLQNNSYKKPEGTLVYLPVANGENGYTLYLAYKFDIYAAKPLKRAVVYVDATEGRVLLEDTLLKHTSEENKSIAVPISIPKKNTNIPFLVEGNAETRYSGTKPIETTLSNNQYILNDTSRGNGIHTYNLRRAITLSSAIEFQDNDNNWTSAEFNNDLKDNAALDAHWGVEKTYDYFKDTFNRNSYDNNGTALKSYVHYSYNYENAGWTGSEMIYGDGANVFNALTSLDITAHELGHAVCQSTAQLVYERESGALNEGFSDIWGAIVEHKYAPEKSPFLIGEEITQVSPGYLRSMSNPKSGYSAQPDTYLGTYWKPATVAQGCVAPDQLSNDYCGVHTNSGVLNHWFYILVSGKSGTNDIGSNYSVNGIGWEKAEQIVYRLETEYVTGSSDYLATRDFAIQAANDLYGTASAEAIAVQDAFYAVGVGYKYLSSPDVTPPSVPLNLIGEDITGNSVQLKWDPSTDNEMMYGYIVYQDGEEIGTTTTPNLKATGLSKLTTYHFTVKAVDIFDNISNASNDLEITTTNLAEYCTSTSGTGNSERIKRVVFAGIDNSSTSLAGYEDFTNVQTDVQKGSTYELKIYPEWRSSIYSEAYSVFIDWNADGDFNDAGENVFSKSPSKDTEIIANITVPQTAVLDLPMVMRVSMKFNGVPTSCETFPYGQVEDYQITVKEILAAQEAEQNKISIYPNPVSDVLNLKSSSSKEFNYSVYSIAGQLVMSGKTASKKINMQKLPIGNYILEITNENGKKEHFQFIKK